MLHERENERLGKTLEQKDEGLSLEQSGTSGVLSAHVRIWWRKTLPVLYEN